jgi:hypothetical protein
VDVGYGPARALRSTHVRKFHEALSQITPEFLRSRYDPKEIEEQDIYPSIWGEDADNGFDYLLEYFNIMQSFIEKTVQKKDGLLIYIN